MKKYHFMSYLLTIALVATAAPIQAASAVEKAKHAAKERINRSIERLQRCVQGNCSRMEALKAARDVTIAVTAGYFVGTQTNEALFKAEQRLGGGRPWGNNTPQSRAFRTVTHPVRAAGYVVRTPGLMVKETAEQLGEAAQSGYYKAKGAAGY